MYNKPYKVQIMIEQKHNLFPFSYDFEGSSSKNSFNQVKIRALKMIKVKRGQTLSKSVQKPIKSHSFLIGKKNC